MHGADFFLDENAGCTIGDECLISDSVKFWGTDGHAIYDIDTGKVINRIHGNISIGNHVWIGQAARFTKNARVASNSIVGMASLVTKAFDQENVIIAGLPAEIVKTKVNWDYRAPYFISGNIFDS